MFGLVLVGLSVSLVVVVFLLVLGSAGSSPRSF